jgi:hypothetical protein
MWGIGKGRRHDLHLCKNSKFSVKGTVKILADSGYQEIKNYMDNRTCQRKTRKNSH